MRVSNFTPVITRPWAGGEQKVYRFINGYGASVVRFGMTMSGVPGLWAQGLWELAVVKYESDATPDDQYSMDYNTDITDDVIGNLDDHEVSALLAKIMLLDEDGSLAYLYEEYERDEDGNIDYIQADAAAGHP